MSCAPTALPASYIMKVLLVGEASVGKTSVINRFVKGTFNQACPTTIGCDFCIKNFILASGVACCLQVWDIAGNYRLRKMSPRMYKDGGQPVGVIVLYDVTNRATFGANGEVVLAWVREARLHADPNVVICVAGNKADLFPRQVTDMELKELAEYNGITNYFETSAKTAENVSSMFEAVIDKVFHATVTHESETSRHAVPSEVPALARAVISIPADRVQRIGKTHSFVIELAAEGKAPVRVEKRYHQVRALCIALGLSTNRLFPTYRQAPFPRKTFRRCQGKRLQYRREQLQEWLRCVCRDDRAHESEWSETLCTFFLPAVADHLT